MFQEANDQKYQSHSVDSDKLLLGQKNDSQLEEEIETQESSSSTTKKDKNEAHNDDDMWSEALLETDYSLPSIDTSLHSQKLGSSISTYIQGSLSSLLPDQTSELIDLLDNKQFLNNNKAFANTEGYMKKM